ncbi:MAG: exopolysaccharide biosynthesis polyprenyl glycosylphosphotransferase [Candidatus Velthaea sp.]|jgi:exopolysaccharide biosynthesis polyprenyl glycosylphosphotransferase
MAIAVATFASSRKHSRFLTASLIVADAIVLTLSVLVADRPHRIPTEALCAAALIALGMLAMSGTYRRSFGGSMRDEWYAVGAALGVAAAPLVVLTVVFPAFSNGRLMVAEFAGLAFIGIATSRTIVHSQRAPRRLAIVGASDRIDLALMYLRPRRDDALLRLPVADIEATLGDDRTIPPWLQGAIVWGVSRVIVTEVLPPECLRRIIDIAARHNVSIEIALTRLRSRCCQMHVEREGGLTLLCPRPLAICTTAAQAYKRVLDLVLTIPAVVVLIPLAAMCALAIKLDSPGPVIYRQTRVGKNGVAFEMLKFRSMWQDAEAKTGPVWADPALPRATRVGRFLRRTSIDELPQLINVLRGEMSLIGPRPERPHFVERFRRELPHYDERLLVSPGITGWSQVSMSRILATDDISLKLEGDLFYLSEWSPLLDAQIIVKTAVECLFHRVA